METPTIRSILYEPDPPEFEIPQNEVTRDSSPNDANLEADLINYQVDRIGKEHPGMYPSLEAESGKLISGTVEEGYQGKVRKRARSKVAEVETMKLDNHRINSPELHDAFYQRQQAFTKLAESNGGAENAADMIDLAVRKATREQYTNPGKYGSDLEALRSTLRDTNLPTSAISKIEQYWLADALIHGISDERRRVKQHPPQ